mgnify:CR=1 FL=1
MKYFSTALIASLMWFATAFAGPLLPLSVQDLATAADVVMHGKVISKKVGRDNYGRIFTTVRLKVQDLWKGEVDSDIFEVVHGGGILGNRKVRNFSARDIPQILLLLAYFECKKSLIKIAEFS